MRSGRSGIQVVVQRALAAALAVAALAVAPAAADAGQPIGPVAKARANAKSKKAEPRAPLLLDDPAAPTLSLLGGYLNAEVERPGPVRLYSNGRWGRTRPWWQLTFGSDAGVLSRAAFALPAPSHFGSMSPASAPLVGPTLAEEAALAVAGGFAPAEEVASQGKWWTAAFWSLSATPGFADPESEEPSWLADLFASRAEDDKVSLLRAVFGPTPRPWQPPCRRRPVSFMRYGAETDAFVLVDCNGAVATDAMDRLSLMARPPEVPRPGALLPDEPDAQAWSSYGEWVDQVRPVHPRLLWLMQKIADAFPRRTIYIYSGYRPARFAQSSHSNHGAARALDVSIMGVRNADLFRFCRTLDDAGCGYYPNSKFVHVDVRAPRTGRAFWVDESAPGEPSRYVDSWPGVVESGALVWGETPAPY